MNLDDSTTPIIPRLRRFDFDPVVMREMAAFTPLSDEIAELARRKTEMVYCIAEIACHTLRLTEPDHPRSRLYEAALAQHNAREDREARAIERVARALCAEAGCDPDDLAPDYMMETERVAAGNPARRWEDWKDDARIAIRAYTKEEE